MKCWIGTSSPHKKKTVATLSVATFWAVEDPQLEIGTCDWSGVVNCLTTLPPLIKCQVDVCTTLVHHVCQGL